MYFEGFRVFDLILFLNHRLKDLSLDMFRFKDLSLGMFNLEDGHLFSMPGLLDEAIRDDTNKYEVCYGMKSDEINFKLIEIDERHLKLVSHLIETFKHTTKIGFLKLFHQGWFKDYYQEYLFVLCGIGLFYFDNITNFNCKGFIPILGADTDNCGPDLEGNYVACIKFKKAGLHYKISGYSPLDINEWILAIKLVQEEQLRVKTTSQIINNHDITN